MWVVTNKKKKERKGKVQLIDGSNLYRSMKKSLGSKRKWMDEDQTQHIISTYLNFEESDISKIFDNEYFGYTKVMIEQPLKENGQVVTNRKGEPKSRLITSGLRTCAH